jgi:hypothetical protein
MIPPRLKPGAELAPAQGSSPDAGGSHDERLGFLADLDQLRRRLVLAEVLGVPVSRLPWGLPAARRRSRRWG